MRRGVAIIAMAAAILADAAAQPLPGLGAEDPRRPVDPSLPPWNAIGRIETEEGARCTGALIGPRLVLTAAHCLVDEARGRLIAPSLARFVPNGGTPIRALSFRIGPGFMPARQEPWRADWAFVTLEADAATDDARALPLLRDMPLEGTPLVLAAWQHDRPGLLSADTGCRALGLATYGRQGLMLRHDCAGSWGSSGAPLLTRGADGRWAILGVQVKAALGERFGVAVPALALPLP